MGFINLEMEISAYNHTDIESNTSLKNHILALKTQFFFKANFKRFTIRV
jgi:hypothetical protein